MREKLREMDGDHNRLSQFHSNRTMTNFLNSIPVPREVPPHLMSKFRRTDFVVVDTTRQERRRELAAQRIQELPETLHKLQQVHQRSQMMQTWIAHEDELALRGLMPDEHRAPPHDAAASTTAHTASSHTEATSHRESHEMEEDGTKTATLQADSHGSSMELSFDSHPQHHSQHHTQHHPQHQHHHPTPLTPKDLAHAATHKDSHGVNHGHHQHLMTHKDAVSKPERYSLASTFAPRPAASNAQKRLSQLRESEKHSGAVGPENVFTSADMERYLAMTVGAVENLVDPSLDCSGNPLSMEEILYGDVYGKRNGAPIVSPFSGRTLKPIIRQDYETEPKRLALLREVETRFHMAQPEWIAPPPSPLEYKYLRPYMIRQVNKLLCDNFWPGIDISESVLYPEFSIVVMYKELVVGCAFISTLGYITYICVHPEWRSQGIARFMLYHLIQTSPGKDITLHVSTTNPALHLYQKFCFLIDDTIPNFYQKYMPAHSGLSQDGFFMRLRR